MCCEDFSAHVAAVVSRPVAVHVHKIIQYKPLSAGTSAQAWAGIRHFRLEQVASKSELASRSGWLSFMFKFGCEGLGRLGRLVVRVFGSGWRYWA